MSRKGTYVHLSIQWDRDMERETLSRHTKTHVYSLWQLSQLSPFWKPAAPFMPGLLPGAMIWLGLGLVLEVERERELMCSVTVVMMEIVHWLCCNSDCYSLGGDVNLLQLAVCFRCLESFLKQTYNSICKVTTSSSACEDNSALYIYIT